MVRDSMYHSAKITISAVPAIQKPCVGTRSPKISAGASPENAGRSYGSLPHTTSTVPSIRVSKPAVSISMLLLGSRVSAGTNVAAPSAAPKAVVAATAPSAASGAGQPSVTSSVYIVSAPTMQNAPCERLMTPVTRKTSAKPRATMANTLPCSNPPTTIEAMG
jgi:hypothetical protein